MTTSANAQGASPTTLASLASLEGRAWTTKLLIATALGILVGAILGYSLFRAVGTDTTATAYLRVEQPPDLVALAGGASQTTPNTQENLQSYASGEVAYLSGTGFAQDVSNKLGKSELVDLTVMQDGETTVVTISNTALDQSDAIRTVATAVNLYRQQLAQRADEQLRTILPVLDQWEQNATPDRVQDIQGLRNRLVLQAAGASTAAVLQTPSVSAETTHRGTIGALLGGLFLGSALPLILMGRRRRAGVVSSDPEVAESVDHLLIPVVPLGRPRRDEADTAVGRTLWAQLPVPQSADRVVVVIGASGQSGTGRVAALLAAAAAEVATVTTLELGGEADALDMPVGPGSVIVDAGALGGSALVPRAIVAAAERGGVVVVVARLGVDTVTEVLAVRAAVVSPDTPLAAVFTHRPWWRPERARRTNSVEDAAADGQTAT